MAATVKATKKTTSRTRPVPAPAEPEGGFEVLRLTTDRERVEERIPVFYIDDVEYTIPSRPRMNVALQFMHLSRTDDNAAMDYLLGALLGEDGYRVLREYDDLTPEQFAQVTQIAAKVTLGALEAPKG